MKQIIYCFLILFVCASLQSQTLIGHYPLDGDGTDISGNSYDAVVTGITITEGHEGLANTGMNFSDGGKMEVVDFSPFDFGTGGEITISTWFKISSLKPYSSILVCGTAAWTIGYAYGINWSTNKLLFGAGSTLGAPQSIGINAVNNVNDGNWHLGVVTVDKTSNQARIYIDGEAAKLEKYNDFGETGGSISVDSTYLDISGLEYVLTPSTAFVMGNSPYGQFFDGDVDDIRIYDGPLNADEVAEIYSGVPDYVFDDMLTSAIHITPNPAINTIQLASSGKVERIEVFNMQGKLVQIIPVDAVAPEVSLNLECGQYLLRIFESDKLYTRRLVIQH